MRCLIIFPTPLSLLRASFVPLLRQSVARRQSNGPLMCFLSAATVMPLSSRTFHLPVPIFFCHTQFQTSEKKFFQLAEVKEGGGGEQKEGGSILLSGNFQQLLNMYC